MIPFFGKDYHFYVNDTTRDHSSSGKLVRWFLANDLLSPAGIFGIMSRSEAIMNFLMYRWYLAALFLTRYPPRLWPPSFEVTRFSFIRTYFTTPFETMRPWANKKTWRCHESRASQPPIAKSPRRPMPRAHRGQILRESRASRPNEEQMKTNEEERAMKQRWC